MVQMASVVDKPCRCTTSAESRLRSGDFSTLQERAIVSNFCFSREEASQCKALEQSTVARCRFQESLVPCS